MLHLLNIWFSSSPCVHVPDGTTLGWMIINMKNTVSARAEITVPERTRAGAGRGEGAEVPAVREKQSSAPQGRSCSCSQLAPPDWGLLEKELVPGFIPAPCPRGRSGAVSLLAEPSPLTWGDGNLLGAGGGQPERGLANPAPGSQPWGVRPVGCGGAGGSGGQHGSGIGLLGEKRTAGPRAVG